MAVGYSIHWQLMQIWLWSTSRAITVRVGAMTLPASAAAALGVQTESPTSASTSPSLPPPQNAQQAALADKKKHLEAERARLLALKVLSNIVCS